MNREFRKGFSLFANYVFSKSLSNVDSELIGGNGANNAPQDYYNLKLEKSITSYDIPHAFKAYANYELPVGRGKALLGSAPKVVNALLGGWTVSAILNYYSGTPIGPFTAPAALSSGWNGGNNRPNVAAGDLLNPNYQLVELRAVEHLVARQYLSQQGRLYRARRRCPGWRRQALHVGSRPSRR